MVIPSAWGKDYPDGGGWFTPLFDRSGFVVGNTSLVGATPSELRKWGYSVTAVPSVEDRIKACVERRGVARIECWAELDQYIMTEVVSRVPYMLLEHTLVVSERVIAYSFDQFAGLPALDRIAIPAGFRGLVHIAPLAWGIAVDVSSAEEWNGKCSSTVNYRHDQIWRNHGWLWALSWCDPMHFQYATGY